MGARKLEAEREGLRTEEGEKVWTTTRKIARRQRRERTEVNFDREKIFRFDGMRETRAVAMGGVEGEEAGVASPGTDVLRV